MGGITQTLDSLPFSETRSREEANIPVKRYKLGGEIRPVAIYDDLEHRVLHILTGKLRLVKQYAVVALLIAVRTLSTLASVWVNYELESEVVSL